MIKDNVLESTLMNIYSVLSKIKLFFYLFLL